MSVAFSVVIPAYNYGHCLERAVKSVLTQDYPHFEVLVIDDGSTDNTLEVMERLVSESAGPLRCLTQRNRGPAATRARGVEETSNEWLIFLDADDELCAGALSAFASSVRAHPQTKLVIAGHYALTEGKVVSVPPGPVGDDRERNFALYLNKKIQFSNGASAIHREAFATVDFREELRHTEDMPVFAHLLACYAAVALPEPLLNVHKHPDSRRNDLRAALSVGMELEQQIFENNGLPSWAMAYRKPYRARRALSLLKLADRGGWPDLVQRFYCQALRADPWLALRPRYVRRVIASLFKWEAA